MKGNKFEAISKIIELTDIVKFYNPAFGCDKYGQINYLIQWDLPL
ncbi:hypothetical protein [Neobacillus paridis]